MSKVLRSEIRQQYIQLRESPYGEGAYEIWLGVIDSDDQVRPCVLPTGEEADEAAVALASAIAEIVADFCKRRGIVAETRGDG